MSKQDVIKPRKANQKKFVADEVKGAARRAVNRQISETALPVKLDRKKQDPAAVDVN